MRRALRRSSKLLGFWGLGTRDGSGDVGFDGIGTGLGTGDGLGDVEKCGMGTGQFNVDGPGDRGFAGIREQRVEGKFQSGSLVCPHM